MKIMRESHYHGLSRKIEPLSAVVDFLTHFFSSLFSFLSRIKIQNRNRHLKTHHSLLSTYRFGREKPTVVQTKPLELFHHSRPLRIFLQIVLLSALTLWTVKNYLHFLKDL
jgi:hypothetical protein